MREDVFKLVHAVVKASPKDLTPEGQRLLEKMNLEFERNGLNLAPEKRERFVFLTRKLDLC